MKKLLISLVKLRKVKLGVYFRYWNVERFGDLDMSYFISFIELKGLLNVCKEKNWDC